MQGHTHRKCCVQFGASPAVEKTQEVSERAHTKAKCVRKITGVKLHTDLIIHFPCSGETMASGVFIRSTDGSSHDSSISGFYLQAPQQGLKGSYLL